ncbi:uncharacterized protein BDZ99DRAFT_206195 [Mytilinidion resinicola]|uniref:Uncharacterized protein n=1 Tax=Mytilinidion resinicola TaxID=574789 RepID=A0A6A6Y1J0_9PEZI|nr:uncharacterized protein BDZ99DRAFT_206195 [Mytilinidion resinicola]KAF2802520.1 hypothetical protein BDZ99DRAFT_206195 [Mytilinidion resinicola]
MSKTCRTSSGHHESATRCKTFLPSKLSRSPFFTMLVFSRKMSWLIRRYMSSSSLRLGLNASSASSASSSFRLVFEISSPLRVALNASSSSRLALKALYLARRAESKHSEAQSFSWSSESKTCLISSLSGSLSNRI